MERNEWIGLGLMCGTSHDGLDMALTRFWKREESWQFEVIAAQEVTIPADIKADLARATELSALEYAKLDVRLGTFFGQEADNFLNQYDEKCQFIASHGVTVFHQPDIGLTTQLGSGGIINAITHIKTISDFRIQDVSKGGQGAPLVPTCDAYLFDSYDYTLNLGGFANVAVLNGTASLGYDISPCNKPLNYIAQTFFDVSYDKGGAIARKGKVIDSLLEQMNALDYYNLPMPKSLGHEWYVEKFEPLLHIENAPEDTMRTLVEHIAVQIGKSLEAGKTCLVTGGGALNEFLIDRLRENTHAEIILPSMETILYKEAIDFAFLGLLRLLEAENVLSSVTGAAASSCSGAIYGT